MTIHDHIRQMRERHFNDVARGAMDYAAGSEDLPAIADALEIAVKALQRELDMSSDYDTLNECRQALAAINERLNRKR